MRCLHKPLRLSDLFLSAEAAVCSPLHPFFKLVHLPRLTPCKLPAQRLQAAGRLQLRGEGALPAPQTPPKAHNWNELIVRKRRPFSWLELSAPVLERGGGPSVRPTYAISEHKQCQLLDEISGVKVYVQLKLCTMYCKTWHETLR